MEKMLRILYLLAFIFASSVIVKGQTCDLTLEMHDSWGDGWNGASVDIVVDGVSNNYTLTDFSGSDTTAIITANVGDVVTISFNSGAFDSEVTFELTEANSNVMFIGESSPSTGLLYTGTACPTCLVPTNILASVAQETSLEIAWTSGGASNWNVALVLSGQPIGTLTSVSSETYSENSLIAGTAYDFYIQEDCGGGDLSAITGPYTFYTSASSGDNCTNAFDLAVLTSPYFGTTSGFADGISTSCLGSGSEDRVFYIVVPNGGSIDIAQLSNTYDSQHFGAYGGACPGVNEVDCIDDLDTDPISWTNNTGSDQTFYWVQDGYNGADGNFVLEWTYTPPPTCIAPASLTVTSITANTADVSWISGGATNWNLLLDDGSQTTLFQLTSTSYSLTNLTPGTDYDIYVQDSCGLADVSTWAGPFSITTLCGVFTPDYLQSFDTFLPNCWSEAEDGNPSSGPTGAGTGSWTYDDFGNGAVNGSAKINLYSNVKNDWIISPEFILPANPNTILEFDLALTAWTATTASNFGSDDSLKVLITTDAGASWIELDNWDNTSTISPTGDHQTYLLDAYNGETVQLAFWATEGTVDDAADIDVFVDNFALTLNITCPAPTAVTASNITQTTVDFAWITGGATDWNFSLVASGSQIGTATSTTVTNSSFTGLIPDTYYDFYVQDSCGMGDVSTWVGPYTFSTLPTCFTPTGLTSTNLTTTSVDFSWTTGGASNWNVSVVPTGSPIGTATSVTSPSFNASGLSPETTYDFYVQDSCAMDDVSQWVGPLSFTTLISCPVPTSVTVSNETATSAEFAWTTGGANNWNVSVVPTGSPIGLSTSVTSANYSATGLSPETTYDFYVQDSCAIGDVSQWVGPLSFTTLISCPVPTSLSVSSVTAFTADFVWTTGGATNWNVSVVPTGSPVGASTSVTSASFNASGLSPETTYDFYVQDSCAIGDVSQWVGPLTITTLPTCPNPSAVNVSNITAFTADFTWTTGGANNWNISVVPTGSAIGISTAITTTDYSASALTPETTYDFYVQDSCAIADVSDWIGPLIFTTPPTCPNPTGLSVNTVTGNGATITWVSGGSSNWNIEIVPNGTTPSGDGVAISSNPYIATGLLGLTEYDVYIQDSCGLGDESLWIGPVSFTTLCGIFTPPYTQNFDSFVPQCWDVANNGTPQTGPQDFGSGSWISDDFANGGTNGSARINLYSTGKSDWILSPEFEIPTSPAYRLEFDLALTDYLNTNSSNFGSDDSLKLLITNNGGATWDVMSEWNNTTPISNVGDHITLNLNAYFGQTIQLGYWGTEGVVNDAEDFNVYLDNFEIIVAPACPEPSAITASNLTDFSADITWTTGGSSNWEVQVVETGVTPSASGVATSTQPYSVTGLSTNTIYDVYVRDNCGASGYSVWIGPYSFATTCVNSVPGDSIEVALPITSIPFTDNGSTAQCFTNNHNAGGSAADVWYLLVSDLCAESIDVSLCGSGFDTKLYLYDADMTLINSNNESCGSQSELLAEVINGGDSIYIVVDGFSTNEGNYILNVDQNYPAGLNPGGDTTITICKEDGAIDVLANLGGTPDVGGLWTDADATGELTGTSFDPTPVAPGSYDFVYTVYSGTCTSGASATLTVNVQKCTSGLDEFATTAITCYPNPNNGSFLVETKGNFSLSLYNQLSQLVWEGRTTGDKTSVDISSMPVGVYFLRANGNHQTETIKVIKN